MRVPTAILAFCLALLSLPSEAETAARIRDLQVAIDGDQILVTLDLDNAFNERWVERLASGLPTELIYDFRLARDRQWFDKGLARRRLTLIAMFDAVRHEYLLNFKLDGRLVDSRVIQDLAALQRAMTHIDRFAAFPLGEQDNSVRLLVRARAELGSRNILSLIPTKIRTDWFDSRKFRPPPSEAAEDP